MKTLYDGVDNWTFEYDANGMRTRRYCDWCGYQYTYTGSQLTQMTVNGSEVFNFTYDASGTPLTLSIGRTVYYYVTNLQGDVVKILDAFGRTVASYTYDAWGVNQNEYPDYLEFYNPLRYRGYVYDEETELYYLQSRYYDPEMGRFINADAFTSTGQGLLGNNMFAYCGNNPIARADHAGTSWLKTAIKGIVKHIVKPIKKFIESCVSKIDKTYSVGITAGGSLATLAGSGQVGVSVDTKGNVAIQKTNAVGGTSSTSKTGFVGGVYSMHTNAPTIYDLNGYGAQAGGTIAIPVGNIYTAAAVDVNIIPDLENDKTYVGITNMRGFGLPGADFHSMISHTSTDPKLQFNIYDVGDRILDVIMEWD